MLKTRMYLTILLVFAIGFAIIFLILGLLGVSSIGIIAVALLFFLAQWYLTPYIIVFASKLKYIKNDEYPKLQKIVGDLAVRDNIPKPRIAISPSKEPNAFVFGRTTKSATLAVHEGLLNLVNDNELKAVLAHEMGHIKHKDFIVMTIVSFIPMLAYLAAESFLFGSLFGSSGKSKGQNSTGLLILIGIGAFAVYFISELLMLSLSRWRELFADSYSADATSKPQDLASALTKITYGLNTTETQGKTQNTVNSAFYIVDGLTTHKDIKEIEEHAEEIKRLLPNINLEDLKMKAANDKKGIRGMLNGWFGTHPPTYQRLILLAKMKAEQKENE
jgi:heat shock protein HtpX